MFCTLFALPQNNSDTSEITFECVTTIPTKMSQDIHGPMVKLGDLRRREDSFSDAAHILPCILGNEDGGAVAVKAVEVYWEGFIVSVVITLLNC